MHRTRSGWIIALALAGCAAYPTRAPEVSLANIDIVEAGLLEQRFALKLRVLNPNDADIPVTGLAFDIDINGQPFAKGVSNKSVLIPRLGEAVLEVDALSNLGGVLRQIQEFAKGDREGLDYRIRGRLIAGSLGSVPFESRGEVKLPRLPGERAPARGESI